MSSLPILKRLSMLLFVILLTAFLIFFFSAGCKLTTKNISEKISDKINEETVDKTDKQVVSYLPKDILSLIPIYPDASLVESVKNETDGKSTYQIKLECDSDIEEISEWYKQSLEKQWSVGSISSGDMGDWSEFYAEAQNENYSLAVYLYQDKGSDNVSIDIIVTDLTGTKTIAENTEQEMEESLESNTSDQSLTQSSQSYSGEVEGSQIALVCASVGTAWNIAEHFPQLKIKFYDEYQFDKGYRIQEILDSEKPDIMIIKECAAYFPPDSQGSSMPVYQNLIRDWVNLCRGQGVIPVLTTVVPIDPNNPSNSGQAQLDSILDFNDWIKQYCDNEEISVLDLEKALHISDSNRALNPTYDSGDGLHPNDMAYTEKLDNILIPALEKALEIGH